MFPKSFLSEQAWSFGLDFSFALFLGHGGRGLLATTLELFGMNWLGLLFLTFVCLFAIDLVTGFGLLLPRIAPSLRGGPHRQWGAFCIRACSGRAVASGEKP